jgi:hypothetical protein
MPTVHHAHLSASLSYDVLPYDNMLTKKAFLDEACGESWRLVLDHEPHTPTVCVEREPSDASKFRLVPLATSV